MGVGRMQPPDRDISDSVGWTLGSACSEIVTGMTSSEFLQDS
jgi:hypothetical protein